MVAPSKIDLATAVLDRFRHSKSNTYASLSGASGVPASTLGHRNNGRMSIQQKAVKQQYLSPQEEKALVTYLLRMAENGFPLPVKFLRDLVLVIVRRRASTFQIPVTDDDDIRLLGKN
jgi:hypothetical protein